MSELLGLIYTGNNTDQLRELTATRAVAAVPICARYRVIDFILSSLVSSGARNVGVITQKNYHSLMDHLGSGKYTRGCWTPSAAICTFCAAARSAMCW